MLNEPTWAADLCETMQNQNVEGSKSGNLEIFPQHLRECRIETSQNLGNQRKIHGMNLRPFIWIGFGAFRILFMDREHFQNLAINCSPFATLDTGKNILNAWKRLIFAME
mmetsp:Transcript_18396/g.34941  ORF Transcript_18396/g.34941 Transcript_18396/m.34941 type:complete len:110 (-) Transcript_18396:79-408(-)